MEPQISPTAVLERAPRAEPPPTREGRTVPAFRLPRPLDLLAVRTSDPYGEEQHVMLTDVTDTGDLLTLTGDWKGLKLSVIIRRIGDTEPSA